MHQRQTTTTVTAGAEGAIPIEQPAGHPAEARLEVSPEFTGRYRQIRERLAGENGVLDHHVALAVLYDEAGRQPDAGVIDFAHRLSTIDRHIRDNPGTRMVSITSSRVKIGKVNGRGLFAVDSTVRWHAARLLLPCTSVVSAGISGAFGDEPIVSPYAKANRYTVTEIVLNNNTTPYLFSPETLDGVEEAMRAFLPAQGGVMLIGDRPIKAFFKAASRNAGRDQIPHAKRVAAMAGGFVAKQRGFVSLGL